MRQARRGCEVRVDRACVKYGMELNAIWSLRDARLGGPRKPPNRDGRGAVQ